MSLFLISTSLKHIIYKVHLSVRLPNVITQFFSSNIGLKQGCNLSPILFNISINDLNEIFDKTFCQQANIKNLTLNNLLYADDLFLVSETSSGLQNCLDWLQEYCNKWRLTVNIKKKNYGSGKVKILNQPNQLYLQKCSRYL